MRDPIIAGVLSLILPGLGQIYNGRVLAGIMWLILASGLWIGTGFLLGWLIPTRKITRFEYIKV